MAVKGLASLSGPSGKDVGAGRDLAGRLRVADGAGDVIKWPAFAAKILSKERVIIVGEFVDRILQLFDRVDGARPSVNIGDLVRFNKIDLGHWLRGCHGCPAKQRSNNGVSSDTSFRSVHIILSLPCGGKRGRIHAYEPPENDHRILATLSAASLALADEFKTVDGKEYKDAKVTHVEPDGIVVKTKSGISKLYFGELPQEVQRRYNYDPQQARAYSAEQAASYSAIQKDQEQAEHQPKGTAPQDQPGLNEQQPATNTGAAGQGQDRRRFLAILVAIPLCSTSFPQTHNLSPRLPPSLFDVLLEEPAAAGFRLGGGGLAWA